MSGKAGASEDGSREGDTSPEKTEESPTTAMESDNKEDKLSETDKTVQPEAKSSKPASSEAVKKETTKHESNTPSMGTEGNTVRAPVEGGEDDQAKDVDRDVKAKPNMEKSPVASKSKVKSEEPEKVARTEEHGKNKIGRESKGSSPEGGTKSNLISNDGKKNEKNISPESGKTQRRYYGTRHATVMQERERFLAMTLDEKRKFYDRKDYVTLDRIKTWSEFYSHNVGSLKKLYPSASKVQEVLTDHPDIEVDEKLNAKVSLFEGDITALEIDGIVNAANRSLLGGGGVDGAIHRAAGSRLVEECKTLSGCETGDAKTTCGYKLPAKYVIHTVGPQTTSRSDLISCYESCFKEMRKHNMRSIAFCCISTGIYGYPNDLAAHDALWSTRKHLMELKATGEIDSIDRIIFCLFLPIDIELYRSWIQVYFPTDTKESGKFIGKNKSGNAEISDDSDLRGSGKKESKVDYSTSEKSPDSGTVDLAEKNAPGENIDGKVGTGDDGLQKTSSDESPGSADDVQPGLKSRLDPGLACSTKL